jgi:hypothetical protein
VTKELVPSKNDAVCRNVGGNANWPTQSHVSTLPKIEQPRIVATRSKTFTPPALRNNCIFDEQDLQLRATYFAKSLGCHPAARLQRGQRPGRVLVAFLAIGRVHVRPAQLAQCTHDRPHAQSHDRLYEIHGLPHPGAMVDEATHLAAGRGREAEATHVVPRQRMARLRPEAQR